MQIVEIPHILHCLHPILFTSGVIGNTKLKWRIFLFEEFVKHNLGKTTTEVLRW